MTDTGTITVRFPPDGAEKRYRASGFNVDDAGNLTLFTGTHKTAWFPAGSHWGAHEEALEDQVVTEGGHAA